MTLVGRQRRWVVDWSHGASPGGVAHNDLRLATGAVSGVNGCWRDERPRPLYLLTYPAQVRYDELGSERERPVNFSGSVNQRLREFWREISGCGRNLEGPFRTPEVLSRTRERDAASRIVANPCQNWPRTRNARQPIGGRRALTGRWFLSAEKKRAPRVILYANTDSLSWEPFISTTYVDPPKSSFTRGTPFRPFQSPNANIRSLVRMAWIELDTTSRFSIPAPSKHALNWHDISVSAELE